MFSRLSPPSSASHGLSLTPPLASFIWGSGIRIPPTLSAPEEIVAAARGPEMKTLAEIYARETILLKDYPEKFPFIFRRSVSAISPSPPFPARSLSKSASRSKTRVPSAQPSRSNWPTATTDTFPPRLSINWADTKPGAPVRVISKQPPRRRSQIQLMN